MVIRPGQQVDVGSLLSELVAKGYRREHQVEHRGEFAVRGGIVDVFPSTADEPVRIDLWGDEVDRLTAFAVSDQRSSHDLQAVALYGCRELVLTPELRAAAASLVNRRTWGTSVWERLERGEQFDGMESWLPFLDREERVLPDLLGRARAGAVGGAAPHPGPRRPAARRGGGTGRDAGCHVGGQGGRGRFPAASTCPSSGCWATGGRRRRAAPGTRGPLGDGADGAPLRPGGRGPGAAGRPGSPGWSATAMR